jgi:hypothetical protein
VKIGEVLEELHAHFNTTIKNFMYVTDNYHTEKSFNDFVKMVD